MLSSLKAVCGVCVIGLALIAGEATARAQVVAKSCHECGKPVAITSELGDTCPHCGVVWGEYLYHNSPSANGRRSSGDRRSAPREAVSASGDYKARLLPKDNLVEVFDARDRRILVLPHQASAGVQAEMFSPAGDAVVTLDAGGGSSLYSLPTGELRFRLSSSGTRRARFPPGDVPIVMIEKANLIYFRDASSGALIYGRISAGGGSFREVVLNENDPKSLFVLSTNARTGTYDIVTGRKLSPSSRAAYRVAND